MANLINKLALAGAIFLSAEIAGKAQYSQKGWLPITKKEFDRLKISQDSIQTIDLTKNKNPMRYTDNSKRAKIFTDTNGETYYWFNPNPSGEQPNFYRGRQIISQPNYQAQNPKTTKPEQKLEEKKLTKEQELEEIMKDPVISSLIKDFNSSFSVKNAYGVLGEDIRDAMGNSWKKGGETNCVIDKISEKYFRGTILKDKKTGKEVLVRESGKFMADISLEEFIHEILIVNIYDEKNSIKEAIINQLMDYRGYLADQKIFTKPTLEEKKDFIRPYFTDSIPNAIKNLPKYMPPIIYKRDFELPKMDGEEVKYENKIKLNSVKSTDVEMDEKKLDEILKGDEK